MDTRLRDEKVTEVPRSESQSESVYAENSLEFSGACEDLYWHHCASTLHRSETNGIAEKAVR